jgi:hypothetical protein
MITITIRPGNLASMGRQYVADVNGEYLTTSRQPFFDGARALLAKGEDPETLVTMRHAGAQHDSFVPMRIGDAAKLGVSEGDTSVKVRKWKPRAAGVPYTANSGSS